MTNPLARDIPTGAAITVVALALVAGVVTGREPMPEPAATDLKRIPAPDAPAPVNGVDLSKLKRLRGEGEIQDVFASPIKAAPAHTVAPLTHIATVAPEVPRAPTTPALPFTYLGRMKNGERLIVYLLKNQEMLLAEPGDTLAGDYRLKSVTDDTLHFVYLPLGTTQALNVPAQP